MVGLTAMASGAEAALPAQYTVVSDDPVNYTPNVTSSNSEVVKFLQLGAKMYAGGRFSTVAPSGTSSGGIARANMFAFDPNTGALDSGFAPSFNDQVNGIATDGTFLYVGGAFTSVNGVARPRLVKLDLAGNVVTSFNATSVKSRPVYDVQYVGGRLLVGGAFTKALVAIDPTTGADTGYINAGISGTVSSSAGETKVLRFAVNPAGTKLVALGNFTTVGGRPHYRAFMLDLSATGTSVSAWNYSPLQRMCRASTLPDYLRDVDFSPDGSYFVLVGTGYVPATSAEVGTSVCDAAARFETAVLAPLRPTWINYTGGDTLLSVTVSGPAVYVGGHNRWLDNPYGVDSAGPGAVSRPGIGAIDPVTGKALSWNPTRDRGVGARELYTTAAGLWLGHDTTRVHQELRMRLAFFAL